MTAYRADMQAIFFVGQHLGNAAGYIAIMAVAHKFLENNIGLLINRMEVNFTGIALRDIASAMMLMMVPQSLRAAPDSLNAPTEVPNKSTGLLSVRLVMNCAKTL